MEKKNEDEKEQEEKFPGYPPYPASEDIYRTDEKAGEIDPEDPAKLKTPVDETEETGELLLSGDDLDVPGSELDDSNEAIGNEDEENNYYSLGGDNHDDLEEDRIEYPQL